MPKKDDKVSIIIPVYNLEDHIVECLKSAIHQTYKNYEIVVVDDGSTDDSLKVCRDFRDKHPSKNIRVIHTRNYGLSHARNRGITSARGKYICFVDGDDTIEPDYIDSLHKAIVNEKAEIAVCGFRPIRDLFMKEKFIRGSQLPIRETTDGETATIRFLIGQRNLDVVTWNKMYLKSLFKKNKIKFPDGEIFEDKLTTYKLYFAAKRVTLVDEVLYNYRQREGSIMNTADMRRRINGRLKAAREAEKYLKKVAGRKSEVAKAAAISVALAHFAFLDNAVTKRIAPSNFKKHRAWILKNAKKLQDNAYITKKMRLYIMMLRPFDGAIYRAFRKVRHESLYVF